MKSAETILKNLAFYKFTALNASHFSGRFDLQSCTSVVGFKLLHDDDVKALFQEGSISQRKPIARIFLVVNQHLSVSFIMLESLIAFLVFYRSSWLGRAAPETKSLEIAEPD